MLFSWITLSNSPLFLTRKVWIVCLQDRMEYFRQVGRFITALTLFSAPPLPRYFAVYSESLKATNTLKILTLTPLFISTADKENFFL